MFFNEPGEANKWKRNIYLLASAILGILLSGIVAGMIEIRYLGWAMSRGDVVSFSDGYEMLQLLQCALLFLGAIGGFFVGKFWWRKIYVERVWAKARKH